MPPPTWPATTDDLDRWAAVVAQHPLWARVPDAVAREAVRLRTAELAVHLAWLRREGLFSLADDAWQDLSLAGRMIDKVGRLADALPAQTPLSAGEVAVLLTVPLLYDTQWATIAGRERVVGPHDLTPSQDASSDRAAFERFAQSYAQPHRRAIAAAARGQRDAAEEIGWWLLHRFIVRQPSAYTPQALTDLLTPVADVPAFDPQRLAGLLWALRSDPGFLTRSDVLIPVAPDGMRERLVGYLLVAARALTIEAVAMPEVIGEHLGIVDPVRPADLHATLRQARWEPRGTALILTAACTHPAVEVALRAHADGVNQILTEIQRAAVSDETLAVLRHVPTHVTTDGLQPAEADGERAYQSAGVRFRLAEDRVQELLMGEQLYGDPALAIRELYQNALDACRYREARGEFLRRTRGLESPWAGQIRFEQGVDADGRPFLDCVDNGIGMGVRELSEVFAQAGVRLADLPEFLEEQAEWARLDPPVQLFPNSRFGIGVLSYFMLADEITVDTCRMGRDGVPGQRLRVSIAGPGSLFRIRSLGPGEATGTSVRLHLRASAANVSCVDTLRSVLWVADFATEAASPADRHTWRPGELSDATPPQQAVGKQAPGTAVVADTRAGVWWCVGDGAILADGLWAGQELLGAVVNLRRDLAPRLSVDRTKILAYREEDLERLLWEAVDALVAAGPAVLSYEWLYNLTRARPLIADVIFDRALASGYHQWQLGADTVDGRVAGCFLTDGGTAGGPDQVVEWRLTALAAAGRHQKLIKPGEGWAQILRARPTDALIMSFDVDGSAPWLDPVEIVPLAHLVRSARRIGRHPSEIAARLEELGYSTAVGHESIGSDPDDLLFMSRDLDGSRPWLHTENPVLLPHVVKAAQRATRPISDVVTRLTRLGFTMETDPADLAVAGFETADLTLCSRDLDGAHPWLDPKEPVKLLHIVRLSHKLNRDIADIAARLMVLGYPLPPGCEGLHSESDDLLLLSRDLDNTSPWLDPAEPVTPVHLLRCAKQTGRKPSEVAARLLAFGFTADASQLDGIELSSDDMVITSRDLEGSPPWLDPTRPVTALHLLRAAEVRGEPVTAIAERLRLLGYRLALSPEEIIVDHLDADDTIITSVDLDGTHPWLDAGEPVPAMHLMRAARATDRDLHDITARLTVFGYSVQTSVGDLPVEQLTRDDLVMTSQDLDGSDPWLRPGERVGLPHVLQASKRLRRPAQEIAIRLRQLGYAVDPDLETIAIDRLRSNDLTYASNDLDGTRPWLDRDLPVSVAHLYAAANKTHQPIAEVAARLRALGYVTPDLDVRLPRPLPGGV